MRIIVCVKQVPDTTEVKIDPVTGTMIRDGVLSILNPDDKNALEAALNIKDEREARSEKTEVIVLSMGPMQACDMLRECLAMGADRAILLSDRAFAGSDTWATANTLASAIRKIGGFDLVLAGTQAIDGDTAQVGPQIAERLSIPQVTYALDLKLKDNDAKIEVKRQLEDGYEVIECKTPALVTALKDLNAPRYMTVSGIFGAFGRESTPSDNIEIWSINDLDIAPEDTGLKASPTRVKKSFPPSVKAPGKMLSGTPQEMAGALIDELSALHVI